MTADFFGKTADLRSKRLWLLDMDGTIYLGNRVFQFAIQFINRLRANGKQILFFTNNASHSPVFYMEKLSKMGFAPTKEEILTSGDVTIAYLKQTYPQKSVYLLGTPDLERQFRENGIHLLSGNEEQADVVISSFDTTLTYEKLDAACRLIRGGARYLCTHPDLNCPTETGFMPDSGAIAALITASTGVTPTYFGKPYAQTLEMICKVTNRTKEEICFLGDRLYTDIAIGKQNGATTVLLLTGETQPADLEAAALCDKPDFVFPSLAELEEGMFE